MTSSLFDIVFSYRFIQILSTPWIKSDAYRLGIIDKNGKILKPRKTLTSSEERAACTKLHILAWNIKRILDKFPPTKTQLGSFTSALLLLKEDYPQINLSVLSEDSVSMAFPFEVMPSVYIHFDRISQTRQRIRTTDSLNVIIQELKLDSDETHKLYDDLVAKYQDVGFSENDAQRAAKAEILQGKHIKEEAPANNVGSQNIAGTTPDSTPGPTSFFGGCPVFRVSHDEFHRCLKGKPKYHRYSKYLNTENENSKAIHKYARKNTKSDIILQHETNGSMIYLRKRK